MGICMEEHTREAKLPHINGNVGIKQGNIYTPKAVTYHKPTVMGIKQGISGDKGVACQELLHHVCSVHGLRVRGCGTKVCNEALAEDGCAYSTIFQIVP